MPIYEYRCNKCGEFEFMQKITDPALKRCPTCQGKVTKLISNSSFHLKGSGWYVTDYGRKGGGEAKSTTGEAKSTTKEGAKAESSTKSGEKSETKSAEKSATKPTKSTESAAA